MEFNSSKKKMLLFVNQRWNERNKFNRTKFNNNNMNEIKLWESILILFLFQVKFKENSIWCLIDLTLPDKKEVPIICVVHVFDYLPKGPTPLLILFQTSYLLPHEKTHVTKYLVQPMWSIYTVLLIPFELAFLIM